MPPTPAVATDGPPNTLPRDPGSGDARVEGTREHLLRQRWLGRTGALRRHPRSLTTRFVVSPLCGEIACTIQPERALGSRMGHQDPNVAIVHTAGCPALLACDTSRLLAFFEQPRLIDDQHGLRSTAMLDHGGSQSVAEGIGIP